MHLAGETGAFKSELAALHQQHFGAGMNRLNLPGAWSSTGNALEVAGLSCQGLPVRHRRLRAAGQRHRCCTLSCGGRRVFRAAGNHAGRGRLDSTAKLREPKPPRALILSTGEDIPRGQSVRARLLILELPKAASTPQALANARRTRAEVSTPEPWAASAMAGRPLRPEHEPRSTRSVAEYRARALRNAAHARTPDIIANLQAAFEMFSGIRRSVRRDRPPLNETALVIVAGMPPRCSGSTGQASSGNGTCGAIPEPVAIVALVWTSISRSTQWRGSRTERKRPAAGGATTPAIGCRSAACIGWVDDDDIYLEPSAAFRAVQVAGRERRRGFRGFRAAL